MLLRNLECCLDEGEGLCPWYSCRLGNARSTPLGLAQGAKSALRIADCASFASKQQNMKFHKIGLQRTRYRRQRQASVRSSTEISLSYRSTSPSIREVTSRVSTLLYDNRNLFATQNNPWLLSFCLYLPSSISSSMEYSTVLSIDLELTNQYKKETNKWRSSVSKLTNEQLFACRHARALFHTKAYCGRSWPSPLVDGTWRSLP